MPETSYYNYEHHRSDSRKSNSYKYIHTSIQPRNKTEPKTPKLQYHSRRWGRKQEPSSHVVCNKLEDLFGGLAGVGWVFGNRLPDLAVLGLGYDALGYHVGAFFLYNSC